MSEIGAGPRLACSTQSQKLKLDSTRLKTPLAPRPDHDRSSTMIWRAQIVNIVNDSYIGVGRAECVVSLILVISIKNMAKSNELEFYTSF